MEAAGSGECGFLLYHFCAWPSTLPSNFAKSSKAATHEKSAAGETLAALIGFGLYGMSGDHFIRPKGWTSNTPITEVGFQ